MSPVLVPGRNCWKIAQANRFALLVDGSNYYGTLVESIPRAQHSIAILGWDLDSRVHLFRDIHNHRWSLPLHRLLPDVASRNPEMHMYILTWSFPFLFANVRDPKLVWGRDPFQHPRIHFKFDDSHPPGASHHQKIVVLDDQLA